MRVVKTREEVEKLKREWLADDCWDIEDTEGFEEYKEELLAFRLETENQWEEERLLKIEEENLHARSLGVEGLYKLYKKLEKKCEKLEEAIVLLSEDKKHEAYKVLQRGDY